MDIASYSQSKYQMLKIPYFLSTATLPHWCKKDNGGCSQICTDLEDGRICSCRSGYQLGSDGQTCEGISETIKMIAFTQHLEN